MVGHVALDGGDGDDDDDVCVDNSLAVSLGLGQQPVHRLIDIHLKQVPFHYGTN